MGWLYKTSLHGFAGPQQYLDAQFTYVRSDHVSKVLRSALVGMRVYYAAVEHTAPGIGERKVWALICLVRYNPRDREGYVFGYKDMTESMGPGETECPEAILDLLTATENTYALEWRARCRDRLEERRIRSKKPTPRPGQIIEFDKPFSFKNGMTLDRFEVVANPRSHRTVRFRGAGSHTFYRIPNFKKHSYRLLDPPPEQYSLG